jgi:hypothetical protein
MLVKELLRKWVKIIVGGLECKLKLLKLKKKKKTFNMRPRQYKFFRDCVSDNY